jgi:hypothetical protein
LFLDLSPPKANKTVSFFVSFHRGATKSGILFLVSIARATARRIYRCRPWLSDVSPLEDAPCWCLARLGVARVGVVGPKQVGDTRRPHPRRGRGDHPQHGSAWSRPALVPALGQDPRRG